MNGRAVAGKKRQLYDKIDFFNGHLIVKYFSFTATPLVLTALGATDVGAN